MACRGGKERGLLNLKSTPEALPYFVSEKNINLFKKHKIFSEKEVHSRYEILMENYCKTINIEALTMADMIKKDFIPAAEKYINGLAGNSVQKKKLDESISTEYEVKAVKKLSDEVFKPVS
jgi:glutamine synthetase